MPQRCPPAPLLVLAAIGGLLAAGAAADPATPPAAESSNPADKAYSAAMHDMMEGMHKAAPTGDADADFVRMMLPHHQAAVDMAKAELQYGKDEGLKALAKEIVTAQEKEIALMKAWEDRKHTSH